MTPVVNRIRSYVDARSTWTGPVLLTFIFSLLSLYVFFFFYQDYNNSLHQHSWRSLVPVFHSPSILTGILLRPLLLVALACIYLLIMLARVRFNYGATHHNMVRLLVFVPACLLTWEIVTYDTNYFLGSGFFFDRICLIVLTLAIWRWPVLVPFYICYWLVYRAQFNYPLGGFALIDKRVLIEFLLLFTAWRLGTRFFNMPLRAFLLLVFCIPASHYFYSGLGKIFISPHGYEWVLNNNLNDLFFNAHSRGWAQNLSEESLIKLHGFFNTWSVFLQGCTLLIELAMVLLLWRKRAGIVLLMGCLLMHTAIFLTGSMFFWKWMSIDLLLLLVLLKPRPLPDLFTPSSFKLSILLIAFSFAWLKPHFIAWHDTPFNQFFTFEVVDENGRTQVLSRNAFNPFHQFFQLDHLKWLIKTPVLPVTGFGYTQQYALAQQIKKADPEKITELQSKYGKLYYNQQKHGVFVYFIKTFFRHRFLEKHTWWYYLRAPHHLYSTAIHAQPLSGRVVQVRIYFEQTWRQNYRLIHLSKKTCEIIDIPY